MGQPHDRVFNFSAGPGVLPVEVLEEARDGMMNWQGAGMSVMEMSHRGKWFTRIYEEAVADLRALLEVPDGYHVLFLQGGASTQFTMVPMNFLSEGGTAAYAVTGSWGKKAVQAAMLEGNVNVVYDGKGTGYDRAPAYSDLELDPGSDYFHFTLNETIQGVDYLADPELDATVVCDMSSNILSRRIDVAKYALIYAGAQKNCGPAGATIVIVRGDMLERVPDGLPGMLDYRTQAENGSMLNTPPCWSVYVCGLVFKHWLKNGGMEAVEKRNDQKAAKLYAAIDGSDGFYVGHAVPESRSRMNVPFRLADDALTADFIAEASGNGLVELKGHRSIGGARASIYNAFPPEGVDALTSFMANFRSRRG
ncbi:MAG: 3-phosphoserine/phosphohydroxythreonine transaminase [Armatimonadetes bacterium]|nr:3-phosphoserine/phosphohydroxythreonine transaminase [Armatimonadota bacterium]